MEKIVSKCIPAPGNENADSPIIVALIPFSRLLEDNDEGQTTEEYLEDFEDGYSLITINQDLAQNPDQLLVQGFIDHDNKGNVDAFSDGFQTIWGLYDPSTKYLSRYYEGELSHEMADVEVRDIALQLHRWINEKSLGDDYVEAVTVDV